MSRHVSQTVAHGWDGSGRDDVIRRDDDGCAHDDADNDGLSDGTDTNTRDEDSDSDDADDGGHTADDDEDDVDDL